MTLIIVVLTLACLCLGFMLLAMSKDHYLFGFFKMFASTGFIVLCIASGGLHSSYGWIILIGLFFSWWGDLFLISHGAPIFMLGLISFFLAHVCYCAAFFVYGLGLIPALVAGFVLCIPGIAVVYWLSPFLGKMRVPVYAYILVITIMASLAAAATFSQGGVLIVLGAVLFYCSDLFVARDRFAAPGKINALVGLPLYYAAQMLLAFSAVYRQ